MHLCLCYIDGGDMWLSVYSSCTTNICKSDAKFVVGLVHSIHPGWSIPSDWRWFNNFLHHLTCQVEILSVLSGIDEKVETGAPRALVSDRGRNFMLCPCCSSMWNVPGKANIHQFISSSNQYDMRKNELGYKIQLWPLLSAFTNKYTCIKAVNINCIYLFWTGRYLRWLQESSPSYG